MKIACDYCDATITNKNKQFCRKECMENYMRMRQCHYCGEKYDPKNDVFNGCDHFCSEECEDKHNIKMNIHHVECALGYGMHGPYFGHELVEVVYKFRNKETGEIIEGRMGSRKEELEAYNERK
jgi:hypothetical protein